MTIFHALLHIGRIALVVWSLATVAHAQVQPDVDRGRDLAARLCSGCHAMEGRSGSTVQGITVPSFLDIANRPHRSAERLEAFVMTPHRPMPGLPLDAHEVRDVVGYILSLR